MAKYNNQKAKILFLQKLLYETGENHTISMGEILDRLLENGIRAERKSIYDDLDVLRYFGMDIQYTRERPAGYYLAGNSVSIESVNADHAAKDVELPISGEEKETAANDGRQELFVLLQADPLKEDEKDLKLLCTERGVKSVESTFPAIKETKLREDGLTLITVSVSEGPYFYGWLTAVHPDVRLLKPKKTAQAYRNYMKSIAKEYKTDK